MVDFGKRKGRALKIIGILIVKSDSIIRILFMTGDGGESRDFRIGGL